MQCMQMLILQSKNLSSKENDFGSGQVLGKPKSLLLQTQAFAVKILHNVETQIVIFTELYYKSDYFADLGNFRKGGFAISVQETSKEEYNSGQ